MNAALTAIAQRSAVKVIFNFHPTETDGIINPMVKPKPFKKVDFWSLIFCNYSAANAALGAIAQRSAIQVKIRILLLEAIL